MEKIEAKKRRVIELLPHLAKCLSDKAVMVGGTALSLFYLNHRSSIDVDFAVEKNEDGICRELKGCLSKLGFQTKRTTYSNVFTVNFPETAVRVEILVPSIKIKETKEVTFGGTTLKVASLSNLYDLKIASYKERRLFRDLFDIWAISKHEKRKSDEVVALIKECGKPIDDVSTLSLMKISQEDLESFMEVLKDASV